MGLTRTETVYQAIRRDLLSARYESGQWMKASDLQQEFDASLSVIREALNRLAAEGLLQVAPQRGFRVIELSMDDLRDLTQARIEIESLVLRKSIAEGDTMWESQLLGAHHLLGRTPLRTDDGQFNTEWLRAHVAFHDALLAGCSNQRLLAMVKGLRDSAEMYRMWSAYRVRPHRDVNADHQLLMEHALERNADACVAVLVEHIDATRQSLEGSPQVV